MMATQRYCFMDTLNVVACIAVVMLHCSLNIFDMVGNIHWMIALGMQCLFIFAVPIFFMISGANLLGYRERYTTGEFFRKRVKRVAITLVVWSVVVYLYVGVLPLLWGGSISRYSVVEFFEKLFTGEIINIYWFFYVIIGLYIMTPILSLVAKDKKTTKYALVVAIILTYILPTVQEYVNLDAYIGPWDLEFFTCWVVYYLLGYYLMNHFDGKVTSGKLLVAFFVCVVIMYGTTFIINYGNTFDVCGKLNSYNNLFAKAEGIPTLIAAPALFLFFKNGETKIASWKGYSLIKKVSALSLDVYACHMLIIMTLSIYIAPSILWDSIIRPVVVYGLALLVAWLVSLGKRGVKKLGLYLRHA